MEQEVWRGDTCLARAGDARLIGPEGRATRIPEEVREALGRIVPA